MGVVITFLQAFASYEKAAWNKPEKKHPEWARFAICRNKQVAVKKHFYA